MSVCKHLEIRQTHPGGSIGITLDGEPVKGCTDLTLSLGVDCIPRVTMTVFVESVDVTLASDVEAVQYEKEPTHE